jgi:hypothetical protein
VGYSVGTGVGLIVGLQSDTNGSTDSEKQTLQSTSYPS